ncbi:hypothetical protein Tco_0512569 [Tanacetum coccineum]
MEDTMLELLKDCRQKEIYCAHNDVEDLIESALNSKLLSTKSKSQRLVQEKQEVKNGVIGDFEKEDESAQDCFVLPIWPSYSSTITPDLKTDEKREGPREEEQELLKASSTNIFRIISSHPSALILGDPTSAVQTRSKVNKSSGAHAFVSYVQKQRRNNHKDFQHFQDTKSLDTCKSAFWEEAFGHKVGFIKIRRIREELVSKQSKDKYVAEILKKFDFANVKTASTPIETQKPLVKDEEASDVDVHLYRFQIVTLAGANLDRNYKQELSISWQRPHFLAMQKANHCGYFYYEANMFCFSSCGKFCRIQKSNHALVKGRQYAVLYSLYAVLSVKQDVNHSSIHHALTVSPVVSTIFVEQFWTSAKSKIINNVRHITAKVSGKPVSISEASIRRKVTPLFASMLVQPTEDEGAPSERPFEAQPTPSPAHTSEVPIEQQTDPSALDLQLYYHYRFYVQKTSGGNLRDIHQFDKSLQE